MDTIQTVLIDDDESICDWLTQILKDLYQESLTIHAFNDTNSANAHLASHKTQLIISDICMPGTYGDFLLHEYLQNHRHTKTILMTGFLKTATLLSAFNDGIDGCILKPFNETDVKTAVDPCLHILKNWEQVITYQSNRN
jgi:two-component system response regulator YesN